MTQFYQNSGGDKIRAIIHPLLRRICCFRAIYLPPLRPPYRFRTTREPPLCTQRSIFSMKMPPLRAPRHHHIAYYGLKSFKSFRLIPVTPPKSYLFETFMADCFVICRKVVSLHPQTHAEPASQDVGAATGREHYILEMRR